MSNETERYYQGVYAGPLTQRATDYNGHTVIGVQISDEAPDGAVFFVTVDDHMQTSITPVMAASIMPYEPAEPPQVPEIEPQDYAATRKSLEDIIARILSHSPQDTGELRTCALAMSELANVIDAQAACASGDAHSISTACRGAQAAQAAGQALHAGSSTDTSSAERDADAEQETEINQDYVEDVR